LWNGKISGYDFIILTNIQNVLMNFMNITRFFRMFKDCIYTDRWLVAVEAESVSLLV